MGWNSARDIFDPVAQALIDAGAPAETKTRVLGDLIHKLQEEDWDTEGESLDLFRRDPAIVEAFRQHGVTLSGDEDEDTAGHLEEARDLARALHAALKEVAEGYAEIIGYDPRLDPDECLPYWLTGINGAPETWQRDRSPGQ